MVPVSFAIAVHVSCCASLLDRRFDCDMIILNRHFTPSALMTVITLATVVLFIMLGLWQLERADFKESIKAKYESRLKAPYEQFMAGDSLVDIDYRKLILEGEFDIERTILVDNRVFQGRAGYEVLTPFILSASRQIVLVNRGWVALGNSRAVLPVIQMPKELRRVKGIASVPTTDGFRMGTVSPGDSWPQVVPFVDIGAMQASFSGELLPIVLWLAPEQAGFYQRDWNPVWADPDKSRAYALQWFIFTIIAIGLYLGLNLRKVE